MISDRRQQTAGLRQPLLGVGDLSVDAVDGPDASSSSSGSAYIAVDVPYGDVVDGDVKKTRGGSREMVITPSTTVTQPYSRLAEIFPSASFDDPTYMSPYYHVVRSHPGVDEHAYLPSGAIRRADRAPTIKSKLPGAESFAVNPDGVARPGEPPLPCTLAHRAILITATDKIDYTTKVRTLAASFELNRSDTEKLLDQWKDDDKYRMSVHKTELLRQLFGIEAHPYYHSKAFATPFLYNQWLRDFSTELHNKLLDLVTRMQKQSLSMIGQVVGQVAKVGSVATGAAKTVLKNVFGVEFHVDDSSMDMFFDDLKQQSNDVKPKPQVNTHSHYVTLYWALYGHDMMQTAPSARVRRTRGVWRYDSAPLEATHSAILDAYASVYNIGPVFRNIVQLHFLSLHLHSSPVYFNMVVNCFNQLRSLQSTTIWTLGEMCRHAVLAEEHFQWCSRCIIRYQEVYALTCVTRILSSVESLMATRPRAATVTPLAPGLPASEIGLREAVLAIRLCWHTLLRHDRIHPPARSDMVEQKAPVVMPPEPLDRRGLAEWLRPRLKTVYQQLYPDVIAPPPSPNGSTQQAGVFLSRQQLIDALERVRLEVVSDRKTTEIYFDDELRIVKQVSIETYVGLLWHDAKMFVQSMGELDVESASNLYVTMRDFYQMVSGYTNGYDPIMDELRGWFGILVDRWLDQLAVNMDKEFNKSGMVTDATYTFTRMDQLSDQIRSRPCSAAQIQRFATLLKTVIKQCIDKVNANVVSLLSSFNGSARMSRELITAINELVTCASKLESSLGRLLADLPAADRDATKQREMSHIYNAIGFAAHKISSAMLPQFVPQLVAVLQRDPPVFMTVDDVQAKCEGVWKYLAGHLNTMNPPVATKGIPLAAEFMTWFGILLLYGVYRALEDELIQHERAKIGKRPKIEKFLRKPQLQRVGHIIQLMKELFAPAAFNIDIPVLPSSMLVSPLVAASNLSAALGASSSGAPAKAAASFSSSLPPLHLIGPLLHVYRVEQLFALMAEPTPSLIEQWQTYPDQSTINNANAELAALIADEKQRGLPAAGGFAAAHADALIAAAGGNHGMLPSVAASAAAPAPFLMTPPIYEVDDDGQFIGSSSLSNMAGMAAMDGTSGGLTSMMASMSSMAAFGMASGGTIVETKEEKRAPASPTPPIVRQESRRDGASGAASVVISPEVLELPLLAMTHRTARARVSRDLLVAACQARAIYDDDSAAQVFVKQFDSKGVMVKSALAAPPHKRMVSSGLASSMMTPPPLMTHPSASGSVLSPQASPMASPSDATTGDGKKKGVFGRLFGGGSKKDKEKKDMTSPPTSPPAKHT